MKPRPGFLLRALIFQASMEGRRTHGSKAILLSSIFLLAPQSPLSAHGGTEQSLLFPLCRHQRCNKTTGKKTSEVVRSFESLPEPFWNRDCLDRKWEASASPNSLMIKHDSPRDRTDTAQVLSYNNASNTVTSPRQHLVCKIYHIHKRRKSVRYTLKQKLKVTLNTRLSLTSCLGSF